MFILAGLLLIALAGEAYFRMIGRFGDVIIDLGSDPAYWRFESGVGLVRPPYGELALSNGIEYWTVQRANSLGFLDREPIGPARAGQSCHISIIGDSFVEANELPTSDKLQVRLEELAAREAPHLDVTTSAFGIQRTGQVNQLAFYDRYARRMMPNIVILVFVPNDTRNNSTERYALTPGYVPERLPYGQAALDEDGNIGWLPPAIDFSDAVFIHASESLNSWYSRAIYRLARSSYFIRWLGIRVKLIHGSGEVYQWFRPSEDSVKRYEEWIRLRNDKLLTGNNTGRFDEWAFTRFAFEQFKRRADHDGFSLMVLAVHHVGGEGIAMFERLSAIAESLGIPIVSQHDYIVGQGGRVDDADWEIDRHWMPAGHQWAAEAVWEYIKDEWRGQCPQVEPREDVEVDWVVIEEGSDEVGYEDTVQVFRNAFGLHHRFHTPEGEVWVQSFPEFDLDGYQSVYESVTSHGPTVRSVWDVHIYAEGLIYLKEPCAVEDVENGFFLHVVPANEEDLSHRREESGFANLDFYFMLQGSEDSNYLMSRGVAFEGKCMVSSGLPEYEIASIRTGQFTEGVEIWSAYHNFNFPEILYAVQEIRRSSREPDIRSNFDVYLYNDQLIYVKESCDADDRDLPFFLHVFPANENELPAGRKEAGFDNLDFELMQKGGESDDACFAAVDLPKYKIDYIRTGQFVRGDGSVWEASIEFAE